ncbi:MAG TPA: oxygenase MpaB family protein [Pyrinomonadaceae bacterium]
MSGKPKRVSAGADAGGPAAPRAGRDFVARGSVVRRVWGDPDLVLLVFAGSAAEFALNRAVDWLFFTGKIPNDPIGRLFSTVRYAQEIVFADEDAARRTLGGINSIHASVERQRGQSIPDWAFRDVLYMLIDYSERAHRLLHGPLPAAEREELYAVFRRVGAGLNIEGLPEDYGHWRGDRQAHMERDLAFSEHTALLYEQYRRHLGAWRYRILLGVQALLVPDRVRRLLRLRRSAFFSALAGGYSLVGATGLRPLARRLLVQPRYWGEVDKFDRGSPAGV